MMPFGVPPALPPFRGVDSLLHPARMKHAVNISEKQFLTLALYTIALSAFIRLSHLIRQPLFKPGFDPRPFRNQDTVIHRAADGTIWQDHMVA